MSYRLSPEPGRLDVVLDDDEDILGARARPQRRRRSRGVHLLLAAVVLLALVGTAYVAQVARGTAITYQIAAQQVREVSLASTAQALGEQLDQVQSAGATSRRAAGLGMAPPTRWTVMPAPPAASLAPLVPVLCALGDRAAGGC